MNTLNDAKTKSKNITARAGKIGAILFWLLSVAVVAVSSLFFSFSANKSYMGVTLKLEKTGWVVESVDSNGAAGQSGIIAGDRPVQINGEPAQDFLRDYEKIGLVTEVVLDEMTVINNNGQLKSANVALMEPSRQDFITLALWLCTCLIFWVISAFIFIKKPGDIAARLFFCCSLAVGLVLSSNFAGVRHISAADHLAVISMLLAPFLLLHFFLVLPEERIWARKSPLVYLIYALPLITLVLYPFFGYAEGQPMPAFRSIRLIELGAALLLSVLVAVLNYILATSPRTRQQMKIIFFGCIAALIPFLLISIVPATVSRSYFLPSEISILFISAIPIAMGYAIVNQKLLNIDVLIRRSVIYGSITLVMASMIAIAVFFTIRYQKIIGLREEILISLVVGGTATILLGPLRSGIETFVDKVLYKDRYDYRQTIQTLSNSLNLTNDATDAAHLVVNTAVKTMNLAGGSLFIKSETGSYQLLAARGTLIEPAYQRIDSLTPRLNPEIYFPNTASEIREPNIAFVVQLKSGDDDIGLLLLSTKLTRQAFSDNDLFLIQSLASISSIALVRMISDARTLIERRQAEEAIKRAAEEWRATFDSIDDMIATLDSDSKILRVNRAFADAFGASPQELVGKTCYEVVHGNTRHIDLCPHMRTLKTRRTESTEFFEPRLGKYVEATTSPIFDSAQNVIGSVHIIKDQTARKQAESEQQRLREKAEISSRLAAVGEMAAGVAHEINNPLTGVFGFSQLLAERQDLPQDAKEEIKVIVDCSQRVAEIVKKLLTFARQSKPSKISASLNTLIDNTLKLRSYVLSTANIEVKTYFDPELPSIVVDAGQLQQVFLNLIINAEYVLKKAGRKGMLSITTRKLDDRISVTFQDNGPGIAPENIRRIFEPFFTTKPLGEGTGLGLSMSRSIILEHGGEMLVESTPGEGAAFTILLPVSEASTEAVTMAVAPPETKSAAHKSARILVVDDEPTIRKYLSITLAKSGYIVDSTGSPEETLEMLRHTSYDILLLDIRLPGMSGTALYEKIKEQAPQLADRVIVMTGDTSSVDVKHFLKRYKLNSISKPFDQTALETKVNSLLQQAS